MNNYNFTIDEKIFTKYGLTKRTNMLGENDSTYVLVNKETNERILESAVLQNIADRFMNIINSKFYGKLHLALATIDLLFPSTMPTANQVKHREQFINRIVDSYFTLQHSRILNKCERPGQALAFHKAKNMMNCKKLQRYPIFCCINIDSGNTRPSPVHEALDLLAGSLGNSDYSLDVVSYGIGSIDNLRAINLALDSKETYHYLTLGLSEGYTINSYVDFTEMLQYINEVEEVVKRKFLR